MYGRQLEVALRQGRREGGGGDARRPHAVRLQVRIDPQMMTPDPPYCLGGAVCGEDVVAFDQIFDEALIVRRGDAGAADEAFERALRPV